MNSLCFVAKSYRASNAHFVRLWCNTRYSSVATSSDTNIKIPNRIPRGPTDILKALENTVNTDLSGPSFRHSDDPHLAPYNEKQARSYSLAKDAGRKAARWVRDEHPELFTQVMSEPPVMSYMPPPLISADTVNENMLLQKIFDIKVTDAIKVYELMREKNMAISEDTKLSLLELLCFYNCQDPIPMDHEAERYYGRPSYKEHTINNWQNHTAVKDLFTDLQHLGSAPYCALICGLYNAGAKSEGDELLQEAKEKKIKLDVNVYNAIILRSISLYEKGDVKLKATLDVLKEMTSAGVRPNLGTLNAAMDAISRLMIREKKSTMFKLLAEFNQIGIKPSPGTLALMARSLMGRLKPDASLERFLASVLMYYKGQSLEARHIADSQFFDLMMKGCALCGSMPLAIECLELFLHSKNRMLADGFRTAAFYNNFFQALSAQADFATLMKYYRLLVPHSHSASSDFYTVLFEACDTNCAIKEFPEIWERYLGSGSMAENTISKMLEVAVNLTGLPDPEALNARPLIGNLTDNFITFKIAVEKERVFERFPLSPAMCNHALILLARGYKWRTIQTCLNFMSDKKFSPDKDAVSQILDNCYDHNNPNMAVWVLKYCHTTFGPKLKLHSVASKLLKSDFLSKDLKDDLKETFDDDSSSSSSSSSESDSSDSEGDSSDSEDISIPKKKKVDIPKPDITKLTSKVIK